MIICRWLCVRDTSYESIMDHLDPDTAARVRNCIRKEKANEIAFGRYMLQSLVGQVLGVPYSDARIRYSSKGRPYVDPPGLYLTSSHCGGNCIAVVSDARVGCDLQSVRRFGGEAVKSFFSEEDYVYIERSASPDHTMTRIWCIKEALFKYLGDDLTDFPVFMKSVTAGNINTLMRKYNIRLYERNIEDMVLMIISENSNGIDDHVDIGQFTGIDV